MEPFEQMRPVGNYPDGLLYWWPLGSARFTVTAIVNRRVVASRVVERSALAAGETVDAEALPTRGFVGEFFRPPPDGRKHPAVLIFGGSDGGLGTTLAASLLAAHGFPTLELAYFKEPGLPGTLSNIPLEYFRRALSWLAVQRDVNPKRLFVSGASRGSEAALLLGSLFPRVVYGVIANVPNNVSLCSYPGCDGPAWTLHNTPLPYTHQFDALAPTDDPDAVIPVERIRGPIFLDCGGLDTIWTSCAHAHAIATRLEKLRRTPKITVLNYPNAGHFVGSLVPYEPDFAGPGANTTEPDGGSVNANERADADLWPRLLAFLRR